MFGTLSAILIASAPLVHANSPPVVIASNATVSEKWEGCSVQLRQAGPNTTHSLLDIVNSTRVEQKNGGEPTVLMDLIQKVSAATKRVLSAWDIEGDGYTLMLPANTGRNYSSPQLQNVDLEDQYPELASYTAAQADAVIRAHIIKGSLSYQKIVEEAQEAGAEGYTVESLQGFEWTWKFIEGEEEGDGYIVLADTQNITKKPNGEIVTDNDLSIYDACPNRVVLVKGFMAAYDLLDVSDDDAPAPIRALPPVPDPETAVSAPPPPPEPSSASPMFRNLLFIFSVLLATLQALL